MKQYYTPIKNILSDQSAVQLRNHFWEYEKFHQDYTPAPSLKDMKRYWFKDENIAALCNRKNYSSRENISENIKTFLNESKKFQVFIDGSMRGDLISFFIETTDLNVSKESLMENIKSFEIGITNHDNYTVETSNDNQSWARFHVPETNPKMFSDTDHIMKIANDYGSNYWCFLHTAGSGITIDKHTDPYRKATITFPLEPELDIYRNLSYYESKEDEEPICIVDYKKINSCVLLNNKEIHCIEDGDPSLSNKTTLCFQLSFFDKTYSEVRSMLDDMEMLLDV